MTHAAARPAPASGAAGARGWVEATRIALGTPAAWPVSLIGFLVRGGILLLVLPVVVLPTPTGLATLLGPDITIVALAAPNAGLVVLGAAAVLLAVSGVIAALAVGGATDAVLVAWAAARLEGRAEARPGMDGVPTPRLAARVAAARFACHVPTLLVAGWAVARVADAVYREYTTPGELSVGLPLRVAGAVPDAITILVLAWLAGEAFGGLAARGIVLQRRSIAGAVGGALASVVSHPLSAGASLAAGTAAVVAMTVPPLIAAAAAWYGLGRLLLGPAHPISILVFSAMFVALWLVAFVLAGAATTWRSAIWTRHVLATARPARARRRSTEAAQAG